MPITASAKKALRQAKRRRERNLARKRAADSLVKRVKKTGGTKETAALLPQAFRAIDKAAQRGVIAKRAAARKKSRLVRALRRV